MRKILYRSGIGLGGIGLLAWLTQAAQTPLLMGSFGASCVILGLAGSPFTRPRAIVGGHVIASFIGLLCLTTLGHEWWVMAVAVALSIAVMHATGLVHPPAGSNPVIILLVQPDWTFLLFPTLAGAVILALMAWGLARWPLVKT